MTHSASAVIAIYVSPPGDISSSLIDEADFTEENFDNAPANWDNNPVFNSSVGTYTQTSSGVNTFEEGDSQTQFNIDDSQFVSLEFNAQLTLELDEPVRYFGFAWPAGDASNRITVYSGNEALFTLETSDIIDFLPADDNATVTAINGDEYDTVDYYGQPAFEKAKGKGKGGDDQVLVDRDDRLNNNEPYAFIHIIADGNSSFDRITFEHLRDGGQFETDNHAIIDSLAVTEVPDDFVLVFDDAEEDLPPIPEVRSYSLLMAFFMLSAVSVCRRR